MSSESPPSPSLLNPASREGLQAWQASVRGSTPGSCFGKVRGPGAGQGEATGLTFTPGEGPQGLTLCRGGCGWQRGAGSFEWRPAGRPAAPPCWLLLSAPTPAALGANSKEGELGLVLSYMGALGARCVVEGDRDGVCPLSDFICSQFPSSLSLPILEIEARRRRGSTWRVWGSES